MSTRFCLCLFAAAAMGWCTGCSSDDQTDNQHHTGAQTAGRHPKKSDDDDDNHNMESPPHIGMTKSQVRAKYGDPKTRDVSDEGESWSYRLNLGEAALRGLNPFDPYGARVRFGQIYFGADGRVKKFHWDAGSD